jgi:hypothetical protein
VATLPPPPIDNAVQQTDGKFAPPWARWLQLLWDVLRVLQEPPEVPAWTDVSAFSNGWVNYDTSVFFPAGYYLDPFGYVHLRGLVKNGTASATMFTLPAGHRPSKAIGFGQSASTSAGAYTIGDVRVQADGTVLVQTVGGANAWVFLDGIVFYGEQ